MYFCRCRLVFLCSFMSALFLSFFRLHPYLKLCFREIFSLVLYMTQSAYSQTGARLHVEQHHMYLTLKCNIFRTSPWLCLHGEYLTYNEWCSKGIIAYIYCLYCHCYYIKSYLAKIHKTFSSCAELGYTDNYGPFVLRWQISFIPKMEF